MIVVETAIGDGDSFADDITVLGWTGAKFLANGRIDKMRSVEFFGYFGGGGGEE